MRSTFFSLIVALSLLLSSSRALKNKDNEISRIQSLSNSYWKESYPSNFDLYENPRTEKLRSKAHNHLRSFNRLEKYINEVIDSKIEEKLMDKIGDREFLKRPSKFDIRKKNKPTYWIPSRYEEPENTIPNYIPRKFDVDKTIKDTNSNREQTQEIHNEASLNKENQVPVDQISSLSSSDSFTLTLTKPVLTYDQRKSRCSPMFDHKFSKFLAASATSQTLTNGFDIMYYATITIGTPGQKFSVIFDSGSCDFWVPALNKAVSSSNNSYNPAKSNTSVVLTTKWAIQYGSGNASGTVCRDVANIAGIKITNQTFGQATQIDKTAFGGEPFDGILGLGMVGLSVIGENPPLTNMFKQGQIPSNMFSVWLNSNPTSSQGGQITFGGINSTLFTGALSFINLSVLNNFWQFTVSSARFGTRTLSSNFQAIADTGTSCLIVPKSICNIVFASVTVSSNGLTPCRLRTTAPNFVFNINTLNGTKSFTLEPSHYILNFGNNQCSTCVQCADFGFWIFGDTFLNKYYTVFDVQNSRIGFATAKTA